MNLSNLKPNTLRKSKKRIGRGGKRGTFSGKGSKGQKSRAGAGVRPGFRGGDNRIWQLFPKVRGASKKPGGSRPHKKHRYYRLINQKPVVLSLGYFNQFNDGESLSPQILAEKKKIRLPKGGTVMILNKGELKKKIDFNGFDFSKSAKIKVNSVGGTIK